MNTMRLTNAFSACAAIGLALGVVVLTGPAHAADDDVSVDQKVMNSIMTGLGFRKDGEGQINYQERAPLVIPPSRELPPPERPDAVTANNPAWPKDPDVERRKAEAAMERNRNVSDEREREQNPLRPDQLTPGRRGQARQQARTTDNGYDAPASGFSSQLLPSQLGSSTSSVWGAMFSNKKDESTKFTGEPPRASLTDPPVGYQTPSPEQPYGIGKAAPQKPIDYYSTHVEPSSGR
jgi:hypothetical protein